MNPTASNLFAKSVHRMDVCPRLQLSSVLRVDQGIFGETQLKDRLVNVEQE